MPITLKIKSSSQLLPEKDSLRVLKNGKMTIGRGKQNDLVLPDPEHRISTQHCIVIEKNDIFYLKDTSTNGVFLNLESSPIGRGNTVRLENGDRITIFQFEIDVSLTPIIQKPIQTLAPPPKKQISDTLEMKDQSPLNSPISTLDDILKQPEESHPK